MFIEFAMGCLMLSMVVLVIVSAYAIYKEVTKK